MRPEHVEIIDVADERGISGSAGVREFGTGTLGQQRALIYLGLQLTR